ncbi:MFS general substrate transporter [Multifurca ochricompacta]|uniref:MFS general substrate transporter n=1 Tax=Multifurca ochricompacta TaxID=376703 RepID=A0AAD4MDW1_9AGAM|nr:MFS general substrate transporter [Multifurca ochricompacta]
MASEESAVTQATRPPAPAPLSRKTPSIVDDDERKGATDKPYSVFTHREKWLIVSIGSYASLFSPLTTNIYLPAIPVISRDFHKSIELINLTVTMHMVMQGISPMIWGTLSDRWGRRPILLACLTTLSLSCVGLALVPTSAYWLLLLLRCVQASGSATTLAVGAGIVVDVSTPAERGGFIGAISLGPMVGLTFGPVIGGALAQGFGWRSIFWFLCIGSGSCGLGIFLIFPETLRAIVGDGSIPGGWIYALPIPIVGRKRIMKDVTEHPPSIPFMNPLRMFIYPDVLVLFFFSGTYYAVFSGVIANLSTTFERTYPYLTERDVGLCFLAVGGGLFIGTTLSGKFLNFQYRRINDNLTRQAQTNSGKGIDPTAAVKDSSFPIEKARLQVLPYFIFIYTACVIAYGWSLQSRVSIAVPLFLHAVIGATFICVMNAVQALLMDLVPNQGSSIAACSNVVRCSMGAGIVSLINPLIVALGDGWAYVVLGSFCVLAAPLLYIEIWRGPVWRERRRERERKVAFKFETESPRKGINTISVLDLKLSTGLNYSKLIALTKGQA